MGIPITEASEEDMSTSLNATKLIKEGVKAMVEMRSKKKKILRDFDKQIKRVEEFIDRWQELYGIVAEASNNGYSEKLEVQYYELKTWLMEHYTFGRQMHAPGSTDIVMTCLANAATLRYIFSTPFGTLVDRFDQFHNQALFALKQYLGVLKQRRQEISEVSDDELATSVEVTRTAIFVGHSFAKEDSSFVDAVLKAIAILGINVVTGEKPKAGRISEKVKERIEGCDPIVVVMTKRARIEGGDYDTSGWLIQEAAYALGKDKKLILMVERGVTNIGGLQGDLEEIRFDGNTLHDAILQLQEVVQEAISRSK